MGQTLIRYQDPQPKKRKTNISTNQLILKPCLERISYKSHTWLNRCGKYAYIGVMKFGSNITFGRRNFYLHAIRKMRHYLKPPHIPCLIIVRTQYHLLYYCVPPLLDCFVSTHSIIYYIAACPYITVLFPAFLCYNMTVLSAVLLIMPVQITDDGCT